MEITKVICRNSKIKVMKKKNYANRELVYEAMALANRIVHNKEDLKSCSIKELREFSTLLSRASARLENRIRTTCLLRAQSVKELAETPWIDSNIDVECKIDEIGRYTRTMMYDLVWQSTVEQARKIVIKKLINSRTKVVIVNESSCND